MSSREILKRGICIASALALLLAVMTSPIRPSSAAGGYPRPDCLRRNFAIPPTHSTRLSVTSVTSLSGRVKALRSESEEEVSRTASPPCSPFDSPPPPVSFPLGDLTAFVLIRSTRPLRC